MTKNNNEVSTLDKIVSAYNKLEEASITWSRKDKCFKLHDKHLTPVTSKWIDELDITSKMKGEDDPITVDTLKEINVNKEDREYFDLPWLDGHIDEEALKYFDEVHDDESDHHVYWSVNGNIKQR